MQAATMRRPPPAGASRPRAMPCLTDAQRCVGELAALLSSPEAGQDTYTVAGPGSISFPPLAFSCRAQSDWRLLGGVAGCAPEQVLRFVMCVWNSSTAVAENQHSDT